MEIRRLRELAETHSPAAQQLQEEETSRLPLMWRCRNMWYQVRCGKPGIAKQIEGLPDFALVPLMAGGDTNGNLREMECLMVPLHDRSTAAAFGKLLVVACESRAGRSWFVSVAPHEGVSRDTAEACLRFGTFFASALQLDRVMN